MRQPDKGIDGSEFARAAETSIKNELVHLCVGDYGGSWQSLRMQQPLSPERRNPTENDLLHPARKNRAGLPAVSGMESAQHRTPEAWVTGTRHLNNRLR